MCGSNLTRTPQGGAAHPRSKLDGKRSFRLSFLDYGLEFGPRGYVASCHLISAAKLTVFLDLPALDRVVGPILVPQILWDHTISSNL
jgi:hypothetical protein